MQLQGPPIEIHIHTADGNVYRFYQDRPDEVARILASIQPQKVFTQKQIIIAGDYFMAGYPSSEVTRIDIARDEEIVWDFHHNIDLIEELSEEDFEKKHLPKFSDPKRTELQPAVGDIIETIGEFALRDGNRVCLRIVAKATSRIDQRQSIQGLLGSSGFHLRRLGGGVVIVNPSLITRWAFYPGMPDLPQTAWPAHRLEFAGDSGSSAIFYKKQGMGNG